MSTLLLIVPLYKVPSGELVDPPAMYYDVFSFEKEDGMLKFF